jgi:hypothetical protein
MSKFFTPEQKAIVLEFDYGLIKKYDNDSITHAVYLSSIANTILRDPEFDDIRQAIVSFCAVVGKKYMEKCLREVSAHN